MNKFLVIARVGDKSLHPKWLEGATPNFDLYISYFGDEIDKYREHAQYYEQVKGGKWPVLARIVADNPSFVDKYDAIWMPDDDLLIDAKDINRMFYFFAALELDLGQPALSIDSYYSHACLIKPDEPSIVRYVNFVEVMAPIFSKNGMKTLMSTFFESPSGWGLDNLWPHLIENEQKDKIGIIDAVTVVHTRPIGGDLYKRNPELSPHRDVERIEEQYKELDIYRSSRKNKFHVFGQLISVKNQGFKAYAIGKLHRSRNKKRSMTVAKYTEQ